MTFPFTRMRRLRRTSALRELVAETMLRPSQQRQPPAVSCGVHARGVSTALRSH